MPGFSTFLGTDLSESEALHFVLRKRDFNWSLVTLCLVPLTSIKVFQRLIENSVLIISSVKSAQNVQSESFLQHSLLIQMLESRFSLAEKNIKSESLHRASELKVDNNVSSTRNTSELSGCVLVGHVWVSSGLKALGVYATIFLYCYVLFSVAVLK